MVGSVRLNYRYHLGRHSSNGINRSGQILLDRTGERHFRRRHPDTGRKWHHRHERHQWQGRTGEFHHAARGFFARRHRRAAGLRWLWDRQRL